MIDKISNFHEFAQNSTYSHKSSVLKYICNFLDQLLHPYKFHGRDMSGILFFIFASCESLTSLEMILLPIIFIRALSILCAVCRHEMHINRLLFLNCLFINKKQLTLIRSIFSSFYHEYCGFTWYVLLLNASFIISICYVIPSLTLCQYVPMAYWHHL